MNIDEWHEQAGRAAYEAIAHETELHPNAWVDLADETRELWRGVGRAVLREGKIEVRRSPELAEQETREENARLVKIAREWAETATNYRAAAERHLADFRSAQGQLDTLREAFALGEASDGHHTFNELYEYRLLYNALAVLGFQAAGWRTVKSWRHSDGELCFDSPDWFVVHVESPAGQITNHYKRPYWRHFAGIEEVERAPEWDGHTPEVAAMRLEASIEFLRNAFVRSTTTDALRKDAEWLLSEVGWPHYRNCEGEQCYVCAGVLGIDENLKAGPTGE